MKTFALLFLFLSKATVTLVAKDKVNVVLIFADDQGFGDLGVLAQKKSRLPILIKWQKKGGSLPTLW